MAEPSEYRLVQRYLHILTGFGVRRPEIGSVMLCNEVLTLTAAFLYNLT